MTLTLVIPGRVVFGIAWGACGCSLTPGVDMSGEKFDQKEMQGRLGRVRLSMLEGGWDALVVMHPANVRYLSGFRGEPATLLVTASQALLLTSFRSMRWALEQTDTFEVISESDPAGFINRLLGSRDFRVGMDRHISHARLMAFRESWHAQTVEPNSVIEEIRWIKSEAEVRFLRESQVLNERIFENLLSLIRPGLTERAAQGMILSAMAADESVDGPSFVPIVAAGANAWEIHHQPDQTLLREGDMVIIDLGVRFGGYASDMTRTICLGHATDRMREIHAKVREAQLAAMERIAGGVLAKDADAAAREVIEAAGYGRTFTHGLGHGIGLETHDADFRMTSSAGDLKLMAGMALTVEPGIYLENEFGVRTEDVVIVRPDGIENLTTTTHDLIEVSI